MSHLHETVAKNVSAAMVYPVLCFIPTRVSLPASMDSIAMTRLRPSKKNLCTQLINSSVQQLYTRVTVYTVRLRTGSKLVLLNTEWVLCF